MNLKVLIVDDEPLAAELMESYVLKVPGLQVAGKCSNAMEAFYLLNKEGCDVMLLDINMPEISGIDLLKMLKNPPRIILTTAYSHFAVESYDLNVIDYLLKPITFERFAKAIHKAAESLKNVNQTAGKDIPARPDILFVKTDGKQVRVHLSQLWFVEALKNYVRLWTENGKVIVHSTMKNMEDQLSGNPAFIRVNKSYIANLNYISEVDGNIIRIKGEMLPIGATYRDDVQKILDSYNLK